MTQKTKKERLKKVQPFTYFSSSTKYIILSLNTWLLNSRSSTNFDKLRQAQPPLLTHCKGILFDNNIIELKKEKSFHQLIVLLKRNHSSPIGGENMLPSHVVKLTVYGGQAHHFMRTSPFT